MLQRQQLPQSKQQKQKLLRQRSLQVATTVQMQRYSIQKKRVQTHSLTMTSTMTTLMQYSMRNEETIAVIAKTAPTARSWMVL
jgi:biopolymer transport protein ExbB/TolQ